MSQGAGPVLPLTGCGTLGSDALSESPCPHLPNGHNDSLHLKGKRGGFEHEKRVKCGEGRPAQSRGWSGSSPALHARGAGFRNLRSRWAPGPQRQAWVGDSGIGNSQLWELGRGGL